LTDSDYQPDNNYYTDAISDHAVKFMQDHNEQRPDQPLFMYVSYTAAHWPMHALSEDVAKYQGRYDAGYEAIRQRRFDRMKSMGILSKDAELSPPAERWTDVKNPE